MWLLKEGHTSSFQTKIHRSSSWTKTTWKSNVIFSIMMTLMHLLPFSFLLTIKYIVESFFLICTCKCNHIFCLWKATGPCWAAKHQNMCFEIILIGNHSDSRFILLPILKWLISLLQTFLKNKQKNQQNKIHIFIKIKSNRSFCFVIFKYRWQNRINQNKWTEWSFI